MVGDCQEPLLKDVVDRNYSRYLHCLKTKTAFSPVQLDQVTLKVTADAPLGPSALGKLCQKIPLPTSMSAQGTMITFDFSSQAAVVSAFNSLQNEGFQLQILGTLT